MPWDQEFECMPVEKLQEFQLQKLRETLAWVEEKVPFYKEKFKEAGISAADIQSLDDVAKLPTTEKSDLRDNYPFGLCAVPMKEVVRVHASSGTTGKPITGPYTVDDLNQWVECMARNFAAAGVGQDDIVQNAYGHGLFTGGLGFHQGATLHRMPRWFPPVQRHDRTADHPDAGLWQIHGAVLYHTVLCADHRRKEPMNWCIDIRKLPLRVGIFGAEPWTVAMRKEIEERMGIKAAWKPSV